MHDSWSSKEKSSASIKKCKSPVYPILIVVNDHASTLFIYSEEAEKELAAEKTQTADMQASVDRYLDISRFDTNFMGDIISLLDKPLPAAR